MSIQANRDTIPFPSTSLELHLPVNAPEGVAAPARQRWNSPFEFFITCVGYAVGLGNFWRFPYLCYKHGGGAFLVPYSIVLVVIGMPLFLLELGVGQKFQVGPLQVWRKIHPSLAGIGLTGALVTFFVALYYNVIVAWALWYLFHSFAYPLPWAAEQGGATVFWEESTLHCRPRHAPNATCSWDGHDFGAEPSGAPGLFAPGLHRRCTASAPPLHRRTVAPLHRLCTASALPLHLCRGSGVVALRLPRASVAARLLLRVQGRCFHRQGRFLCQSPAISLHLPRPFCVSQPRPLAPQPLTLDQVALFTALTLTLTIIRWRCSRPSFLTSYYWCCWGGA